MAVNNKHSEKFGITYFGLDGHEIAVLESMVRNLPDLSDEYELRAPSQAGKCDVVIINKDSQLALSWWKSYKNRNLSAKALFLSDRPESSDKGVYSKRPFLPSVVRAALKEIVDRQSKSADQGSAA